MLTPSGARSASERASGVLYLDLDKKGFFFHKISVHVVHKPVVHACCSSFLNLCEKILIMKIWVKNFRLKKSASEQEYVVPIANYTADASYSSAQFVTRQPKKIVYTK